MNGLDFEVKDQGGDLMKYGHKALLGILKVMGSKVRVTDNLCSEGMTFAIKDRLVWTYCVVRKGVA